jgi:phage repressor protein C with HTH and peptisase S24 domain
LETARSRILYFIENQNIKPVNFLKKTGLGKGFVDKSHVNSGASDLYLAKILDKYPSINPEWLLTGKGEMLKSEELDTLQEPKIDYNKKHINAVPFYDIDISAGLMEFFNDEKETPSGWVNFPDFPKSNAVVNAYSDSMSDYINNGDKIAIRLINDLEIIEYGQCFVIVTQDYRFVKFIRKSDTPENIKLVSYNTAYDDFEIPKSKILKLFLVTYVFKPTAN